MKSHLTNGGVFFVGRVKGSTATKELEELTGVWRKKAWHKESLAQQLKSGFRP
jgi:hypothetical protein